VSLDFQEYYNVWFKLGESYST